MRSTPDAIPPRSRRGCGRIRSRRTDAAARRNLRRRPWTEPWRVGAGGPGHGSGGRRQRNSRPRLGGRQCAYAPRRCPPRSRLPAPADVPARQARLHGGRGDDALQLASGAARRHRPRALGRLGLHHLGRHAPLHRRCRALGHDHVRHPRRDADHRLAHRRELRDRHEPADCAKPARLDGAQPGGRRSPAASSASCSSSRSPSCSCRAPVQGGWDAHPGCVGVGWVR